MSRLRLDSEQLSFYRTKRGLIHVRDTYAEADIRAGIRADATMCGTSLDKLSLMVEREVADGHLCQRCGASLVSERKWGNLGVSKHHNRWSIV